MNKTSYEIIIQPGGRIERYWRDIWQYRELFVFLAWRDILVRYKQTVIGIAWSVIRPLLTAVVFTIVFGNIAKLPSDGAPYPILVYSAMLPWQFFSSAMSEASNSLIGNANMISKVYFPRLIVPTSTVIVCLVDFFISLVILIGLMIWYQFIPSYQFFCLPLLVIFTLLPAIGCGVWLAALNVKYRDFRYIIPFIVQFGLYISPVGFSSSVVPEKWKLLYDMNPMVGVIDGFRWAIIGNQAQLDYTSLFFSGIISTILFFGGIWYFIKTEKSFADII